MRRQWPCSKCGFACPSTWRSLDPHPYKPVICNTCKSKNGKNKAISDPFPKQILNNNGPKINMPKSPSLDQISTVPSNSSVKHENMGFTVSQFGMIFGNLPFEPTLAVPVIVHDDKVDDHCKCGTILKSSISSGLESGMVPIKKEYDSDQEQQPPPPQDQAKVSTIWDPSKVQKKRRSKLPQYTLSPIARFIIQLQLHHHLSLFHHHHHQDLKYDDVLIYEKCSKFLAENEVGLGAVMLSKSVSSNSFYKAAAAYSVSTVEELSSFGDDQSDAYSNCLIDVPIRSSPSQ